MRLFISYFKGARNIIFIRSKLSIEQQKSNCSSRKNSKRVYFYVYFFSVERIRCMDSFRGARQRLNSFVLDKNDESCIVDSRKCEFSRWHLFVSIETVKFPLLFRKHLQVSHLPVSARSTVTLCRRFPRGPRVLYKFFANGCIGECYLHNCIAQKSFMLLPLSSPICPVYKVEKFSRKTASNLMSLDRSYCTMNFQHKSFFTKSDML